MTRRPLRRVALILTAALAPLSFAATPARAAEPAATDDPVRFFTGTTEGAGKLKKLMSTAHGTRVHGRGFVRGDGALVLDQTVEEEGEPVKTRHWLLREVAPGRYSGTISDARGPVTVAIAGNRMTIRYTMTTGFAVAQEVVVAPDGQSAHNMMKVKRFGITVATVDETMRRH